MVDKMHPDHKGPKVPSKKRSQIEEEYLDMKDRHTRGEEEIYDDDIAAEYGETKHYVGGPEDRDYKATMRDPKRRRAHKRDVRDGIRRTAAFNNSPEQAFPALVKTMMDAYKSRLESQPRTYAESVSGGVPVDTQVGPQSLGGPQGQAPLIQRRGPEVLMQQLRALVGR